MNKGKILVSNFTLLNDLEFNKAVIIMVKDDYDGSIGFVLNKKTKYLLSDFYEGGPVMMDSLHFIHMKTSLLNDSIKITEDLYWGINFNNAVNLLKQKKIKKTEIKFFIGYSGWEKNQLKSEIEENSWLISSKFKNKDILNTENEFWKSKLNEFGEYYKIWSNSPDNPNLN